MNPILFPKTRKEWTFYLVLPALVVPFLIILFFLAGAGKTPSAPASVPLAGLNATLPEAHFGTGKDKGKLELYDAAKGDSQKPASKRIWDYFTPDSSALNRMSFQPGSSRDSSNQATRTDTPHLFPAVNARASNEEKERDLEVKLKALQQELNRADLPPSRHRSVSDISDEKRFSTSPAHATLDPEPQFNPAKTASSQTLIPPDPEIVQLNQMLDKLMILQRPERSGDSSVDVPPKRSNTVHVQSNDGGSTLSVIIPQHQTLVSGSTICLQATETAQVGTLTISPGQLVYGVVSLSSERLKIQVHSLRKGKTITPVNLEGYDLDGLAGIYIPGSLDRDVSKESFDQGMGGLGVSTLDPSIGAQAASAGIQTAKTLLRRHVKLVRVHVPAGYQLLLKDAR